MKKILASIKQQPHYAIGIAVLLFILLWLFVLLPIYKKTELLQQRIAQKKNDVGFMQEAAKEVKRLRTLPKNQLVKQRVNDKSLLAVADETTKMRGLQPALKRIEPVGEHQVRLLFESVQFNAFFNWLESLEYDHGITTKEINVDKLDRPGLVNVRLVVQDNILTN